MHVSEITGEEKRNLFKVSKGTDEQKRINFFFNKLRNQQPIIPLIMAPVINGKWGNILITQTVETGGN